MYTIIIQLVLQTPCYTCHVVVSYLAILVCVHAILYWFELAQREFIQAID